MNESFKTSEFILDATRSVGDIIYHVYNQGYEDGKESVQIDETEAYKLGYENGLTCKEYVQIDESTAYKAGLETAWELARKLSNLGFNDKRQEIFGEKYGLSIDIINNFSVDEVMEKIKDTPIICDILHDKCPYPEKKCRDCTLYKAFRAAKRMEELNELESKDKEND